MYYISRLRFNKELLPNTLHTQPLTSVLQTINIPHGKVILPIRQVANKHVMTLSTTIHAYTHACSSIKAQPSNLIEFLYRGTFLFQKLHSIK
jgi:hypothetical protein